MSTDKDTEVHHMLGAIQSDVRHVLTSVNGLTARLDSLEKRITAVEKFNVRVLTLASIIGVVLTAFFSGITKKLIG